MSLKFTSFGDANAAPYSDIVTVDNKIMYLSGLVSEDLEKGVLLPGSITDETKVIFENMKKILEENGSDMNHVIKTEVLLHDFSERDEMNEEYKKHFAAGHRPARLCYGGVDLADGLKIEVTAIAIKIGAVNPNCPCPKECEHHGHCDDCKAYHEKVHPDRPVRCER